MNFYSRLLPMARPHKRVQATIEMIAFYGKNTRAGKTTFDTCVHIGTLCAALQDAGIPSRLVLRKTVVTEICGTSSAKDADVRQALIDLYGGESATKKGGMLYKVSKDIWSALAIARASLYPCLKLYELDEASDTEHAKNYIRSHDNGNIIVL